MCSLFDKVSSSSIVGSSVNVDRYLTHSINQLKIHIYYQFNVLQLYLCFCTSTYLHSPPPIPRVNEYSGVCLEYMLSPDSSSLPYFWHLGAFWKQRTNRGITFLAWPLYQLKNRKTNTFNWFERLVVQTWRKIVSFRVTITVQCHWITGEVAINDYLYIILHNVHTLLFM